MNKYPEIQSIYKRDPKTKYKTFLEDYSLPEFEYLKDNLWMATEKVDGTNIRITCEEGGMIYGGRTDNAQIPAKLLNNLNNHFLPLIDVIEDTFGENDFCLYGEGFGAKIQKAGGNYRDDQGFVLFDVQVGRWWLDRESLLEIALALKLDVVPIVSTGTLDELVGFVRGGFDSTWGNFAAEGIVAKPLIDLQDRSGHRLITKIKHRDFN